MASRQGQPGEHSSRDYDFSEIAIRTNREQGYALARETLEKMSANAAAPEEGASRSVTRRSLPSISQSGRLAKPAKAK